MDSQPTSNHGETSEGEVVKLFGRGVGDFGGTQRNAKRLRVALIGTFAPRQCGIATFTTDVRDKLATYFPDIDVDIYALEDGKTTGAYASGIHVIAADAPDSYQTAARAINEAATDVVWLQHEFGIFGGKDGAMVCDLIDSVAAPLVTTFHTVLPEPSDSQRAIMEHLITRCSRIMVMSQHGHDLLVDRYRARAGVVEIIEHGAPDRPFGVEAQAKERMELEGRYVLTTFGLLGPGKGLEHVIEALPAIIAVNPNVVYRIVGATHPVLVAREGETYRESLMARSQALGVADHIIWENRFLDTPELLDQLEACDIYITPYPNMGQSTSGTLSYAVALGKAVVSTPYIHARELLGDGVGHLIAPNDPAAIAGAVNNLLASPEKLLAMKMRAYDRGRRTIWPLFAKASARLIRNTVAPAAQPVSPTSIPGLSAVWAMSDSTGIYQHSIGVVPDRRHGYCLDDNVRALMLMNVAGGLPEAERMRWSTVYAGFVQYAWNPDVGRFRNFMRFDRGWCESEGSEDSNGRTLWALGHTIEKSPLPDMAAWAMNLYDEVAATLETIRSPRAMAFAALGAIAVLRSGVKHPASLATVEQTGTLLSALVNQTRRPDWAWFETVLGYDNPRLCQALIESGHMLGRTDWIQAGIDTLEWLATVQIGAAGQFRAVGSDTFGHQFGWRPFDQQPLEAQAAIEAAHSAWTATGDERWIELAHQAYQWFFGANDRGVVLADIATGRCRDGITPRGRNENSGAESILAFQLSHYSLAELLHTAQPQRTTGNRFGYSTDHDRPQSTAHS